MDFMFFVNNALLGVGLAMDAFSISLANGLNESNLTKNRMSAIAGVYAFFQFFMPMVGWICVQTICSLFSNFLIFIPWIALILLLYIGGKMILETIIEKKAQASNASVIGNTGTETGNPELSESNACTQTVKHLTFGLLILQGIATSIDALSVGFTIAEYTLTAAFVASLIIAVVTFAICYAGLIIGKKVGTRLAGKANILGGTILILIGIEIFIKGMFF